MRVSLASALTRIIETIQRIMRLNFSHATEEEVELRLKNLKASKGRHSLLVKGDEVEASTGESSIHKNVRAVLLDTRGPEVRSGKLAGDTSGKETVNIEAGSTVALRTTEDYRENSTASDLFIDYPKLAQCLSPGMKVLLDDGAIILTVTETEAGKENGSVYTTADNSGEIRSRAGVNLPGAETDLPAMSEKDKVDIKYGMTKDVDYVAASFIQNAEGVREIRTYMEKCAKELEADGHWEAGHPIPLIISKIESVSGLKHFDAILDESDGISKSESCAAFSCEPRRSTVLSSGCTRRPGSGDTDSAGDQRAKGDGRSLQRGRQACDCGDADARVNGEEKKCLRNEWHLFTVRC